MKVTVNLNDTIHVKLTKFGIAIMEAEYDSIFKGRLAEHRPKVQIDEDGYTSFQLWSFMNTFGQYAYCGIVDMPYETNVIIDDAEPIPDPPKPLNCHINLHTVRETNKWGN